MDLRKQNERLELTLMEVIKKFETGTNLFQAEKDQLVSRLDCEIRCKSELKQLYKDEIYKLQHTINKHRKETDDLNATTANEVRKLKVELATKEEHDASLKFKHDSYDGLARECKKLSDELITTKAELDDTRTR